MINQGAFALILHIVLTINGVEPFTITNIYAIANKIMHIIILCFPHVPKS